MNPTALRQHEGVEIPPVQLRKFTVNELHRMVQAGVFADDDRCELLEGWLVQKPRFSPGHEAAIHLTQEALLRLLPDGWQLRSKAGVTTLDSEPEPDLVVVRGRIRDYASRHPGPEDVALVIEVADSSLEIDCGIKPRLYARAGIVCYWIINLVDLCVEQRTQPSGPAPAPSYLQSHRYVIGEEIPLELAGQLMGRIAVRDMLP